MNNNEREKSYHDSGRSESRRSRAHVAKPSPYAYRTNHGTSRRARRIRVSRNRVFATGFLVSILLGTVAISRIDFQEVYYELNPKDVLSMVEPLHIEIYQYSDLPLMPEIFLENLNENENYITGYVNGYPSVAELGDFHIPVFIKDDRGESREIEALLSVRRGSDLPEILGVEDIFVILGDTISYRNGVTATDYYGNPLEVTIDNTAVNVNTEGEYPVIYTAMDRFGNVGEMSATVIVYDDRDATQIFVEDYIDDVFARIFTPEMTQREQAYAIYKWCKNNVRYASSGPNDDNYSLAYGAFRGQSGDCYTFFAVEYLMLLQAGIPVIPLERVQGTGINHKWVAVNTGDGWYHYDACPTFTGDWVFMIGEVKAGQIAAASDLKTGYKTRYFEYASLPEGVVIEDY